MRAHDASLSEGRKLARTNARSPHTSRVNAVEHLELKLAQPHSVVTDDTQG